MAIVAGLENITGINNTDVHSPRTSVKFFSNGLQHSFPDIATFPKELNELPFFRLTTLGCFHHGRGSILFLLEYILPLDRDSPSMNAMLQQKLLSVYLQNTLSTVIVYNTPLIQIKKLSSEEMCCNRLMFMEFTILPCSPTF